MVDDRSSVKLVDDRMLNDGSEGEREGRKYFSSSRPRVEAIKGGICRSEW